mmetsp:Transcript_28421/g.65937  ORF Transcript_28421/g.65937 Transcript_28421/m.65937 type:complete len:236 (+) Transcript_28421:997-1704(+)
MCGNQVRDEIDLDSDRLMRRHLEELGKRIVRDHLSSNPHLPDVDIELTGWLLSNQSDLADLEWTLNAKSARDAAAIVVGESNLASHILSNSRQRKTSKCAAMHGPGDPCFGQTRLLHRGMNELEHLAIEGCLILRSAHFILQLQGNILCALIILLVNCEAWEHAIAHTIKHDGGDDILVGVTPHQSGILKTHCPVLARSVHIADNNARSISSWWSFFAILHHWSLRHMVWDLLNV